MRKRNPAIACAKALLAISAIFTTSILNAQTTRISDYVIFGGSPANSAQPSCGVQLGSSTTITGGSIGSYAQVSSTGNASFSSNLFSGGSITLANSNTISGRIAAGISSSYPLNIGSNTNVGGNIDVNGNTRIAGGIVNGKVTHPKGTTYTGPVPKGGEYLAAPSLPVLPAMPAILNFPAAGSGSAITTTQSISSGAYNVLSLTGNKTITFSGTGEYVFNKILNTGSTNNFVFDFKGSSTGTIKIYVYGDVDLGKVQASIVNGGAAGRIFLEVHGTGSTCSYGKYSFIIANGSSGQASKWLGSVWAPNGGINIGSGTGSSSITGALWSATSVTLQSGVTINFEPYVFCTPPNVNAGPDKPLDFSNPTLLTGSTTTPGASLNWSATNGGVIASPANNAQITVTAAGTYILTASVSAGCSTSDTAIVTGKIPQIIGSELQSVFQNFDSTKTSPSPFFTFSGDSVMIDVIAREGKLNDVVNLLTTPAYGLTNIINNGGSNYLVTGLFPVRNLPLLNALGSLIVYVRPYYKALTNSGIASTAGDSSVGAQLVRKGYGLSGAGVKIGVISDSYNTITTASNNPVANTAAQDVSNGDLPGPGNPDNFVNPVHVLKDYPSKASDEGRGMLGIVHDIAPASELWFRTGFISPGDFAQGILELRNAGCDVIVDDITFITEPFLTDGIVAKSVDQVVAAGATYVSAAGNFADKSYENSFNPVAAPGGLPGTAHNFGGGDVFQNVTLAPGDYTIVLQWTDDIYSLGQTSTGGTKNDLDIYLTPNTDGSALFGFNRNNTNGDPIEILPFSVTSTTNTNILITNNTTGSTPARFKYIVYRGNITFNEYATGTSTITGQANSPSAITVGAVRYDKAPPYPGPLTAESFSSVGGTTVNNVKRNKPDISGPDGVNTTVNLGIDYDHDGFSNFFGTSAAAPHVGAVAALLIEGKRKYNNQATVTPAEIKSLLMSTATDMGTPGFDFSSGAGFVNADSAMRTFAKPDPSLIKLNVPTNTTPGTAPFTLTVTGLNLSSTSVIKFRDSTLGTTVVNSTTATATVPSFIGDPIISVYTPPTSASQLDGGYSDTLRFFNVPKKNITVFADTVSKKYGQALPAFTATVLVDGDSLKNTSLTMAALGLDSLKYQTAATAGSDVGTYALIPSRIFDKSKPLDAGLLELYNYSFRNGTVNISPLPLTITAQGGTINYGEKIPAPAFVYQFDGAGITDSAALMNNIQSSHQSQLAKDDQGAPITGLVNGQAVMIINGRAVPIVNGQAVTIVNGQAVTIVNGQAVPIVNSQAVTIVNGQAVPIVNNLASDQVAGLNFQATTGSLQHARRITNRKLVNGVYQTDSSSVVDIAQESILKFNVNSAQTSMVTSVSNTSSKGIVDVQSYANGQAVTIVNQQAVTIVNGQAVPIVNQQAVTIVNGRAVPIVNQQAVTIVNGQAVTIVNGQAVPIVNGQGKSAVIIDSSDIGLGQQTTKSVNVVTGLDAGQQFIIPGSLNNSNLKITYIAGILNINPAAVTITPDANQSKVYGTADSIFTFTNNGGLDSSSFTGRLSRVAGEDAGSYAYTLGNLSAGSNYSLLMDTRSPAPVFVIKPKTATITPSAGQTKVYGDADPVFTYTNDAGIASFTGKLGRAAGENVGNYAYTLGTLSAGNNYLLSLNGTNSFAITKASLTVKANNTYIFQGDPLPTFTATITGLKNNDKPVISFTVTPVCTGKAGTYTIVPAFKTFANAGNYNTTFINGILYVNPDGNGAKKLKPSLDCIFEITSPSPGQFRYIAHFVCQNDNATPLYVPIGTDNSVSSASGLFDASAQPVVFMPGLTRFDVPFDGNKVTWTVRSYDSDHKTSVASNASSTSSRCSNNVRMMDVPAKEERAVVQTVDARVYPNPAHDRVVVNLKTGVLSESGLAIYSAAGVAVPVKAAHRISAGSIELDITNIPAGYYVVKVKSDNNYQIFRFVKY